MENQRDKALENYMDTGIMPASFSDNYEYHWNRICIDSNVKHKSEWM